MLVSGMCEVANWDDSVFTAGKDDWQASAEPVSGFARLLARAAASNFSVEPTPK
jgi:hypothetical protein